LLGGEHRLLRGETGSHVGETGLQRGEHGSVGGKPATGFHRRREETERWT
jgi:hypothetical protein